jgi:anti-sigma B factor antagonist
MLKIDVRRTGTVCILDLEGQIDGGSDSAALQSTVRKELSEGSANLLINLAGVKWVNSLGVGNLIAAFASAKREGAVLKFFGASDRVATVLRTAGVIPSIFEILGDENEALASFS